MPALITSHVPSQALSGYVRPDALYSERAENAVEIANTPALRAEAERLWPAVVAEAEPVGAEGVALELGPLLTVFYTPERTEGEWAAFWELYADVLADLPRQALKAGVSAYLRQPDAVHFPKPGPLRALCAPAAAPARVLRRILEVALALDPLPDRAPAADRNRQRDAAWKALLCTIERTPDTATPWLNGSGNLAPPVPL